MTVTRHWSVLGWSKTIQRTMTDDNPCMLPFVNSSPRARARVPVDTEGTTSPPTLKHTQGASRVQSVHPLTTHAALPGESASAGGQQDASAREQIQRAELEVLRARRELEVLRALEVLHVLIRHGLSGTD